MDQITQFAHLVFIIYNTTLGYTFSIAMFDHHKDKFAAVVLTENLKDQTYALLVIHIDCSIDEPKDCFSKVVLIFSFHIVWIVLNPEIFNLIIDHTFAATIACVTSKAYILQFCVIFIY